MAPSPNIMSHEMSNMPVSWVTVRMDGADGTTVVPGMNTSKNT